MNGALSPFIAGELAKAAFNNGYEEFGWNIIQRFIELTERDGTMVDVRYILTDEGMRYDVYSPAKRITAHILLPKGKSCRKLLLNGIEKEFGTETIGDSEYLNTECVPDKKASFEILFF